MKIIANAIPARLVSMLAMQARIRSVKRLSVVVSLQRLLKTNGERTLSSGRNRSQSNMNRLALIDPGVSRESFSA